ncbi:hypothetical protein H0H87_007355, partial [Tephrocybe sp. NHM501043]
MMPSPVPKTPPTAKTPSPVPKMPSPMTEMPLSVAAMPPPVATTMPPPVATTMPPPVAATTPPVAMTTPPSVAMTPPPIATTEVHHSPTTLLPTKHHVNSLEGKDVAIPSAKKPCSNDVDKVMEGGVNGINEAMEIKKRQFAAVTPQPPVLHQKPGHDTAWSPQSWPAPLPVKMEAEPFNAPPPVF